MDGLDVLDRLRALGSEMPAMFLTAKDATEDRVAGLAAGSDDYVTKPFSMEEVLIRAHRLVQRSGVVSGGSEVLVVGHTGATKTAVVGRVKTEIRPMLLITAEVEGKEGKVFLQNAETIRLVTADGKPVSVVTLTEGDKVLVRTDVAGRHFGMRIAEDIKEG